MTQKCTISGSDVKTCRPLAEWVPIIEVSLIRADFKGNIALD